MQLFDRGIILEVLNLMIILLESWFVGWLVGRSVGWWAISLNCLPLYLLSQRLLVLTSTCVVAL